MPFETLKYLLPKTLKRAGIKKQTETAIVLDRAREYLAKALSDEFTREITPAYVKYRTLTIACLSSAAASSVSLMEEELLEYVNKSFPRPMIDRILVVS